MGLPFRLRFAVPSRKAMKLPRIALLTVGDEVLGGRTLNTNAAWLAQRLSDRGFLVVATETVGDEEFAIADAIKGLCAKADAVMVTGGLGPTPDDITREAMAGAAGRLLVVDKKLKAEIGRKTGGRAPARNARMARVPEGATVFPNPVGTAAGLRVEMGGTPVYALPGVPFEMEAIFEVSVLPDLARTFAGAEPVPQRTLRIFGLREAEVADRLGPLLDRGKEPTVGVTVREGIITVTVIGEGADLRVDEIRRELGDHVFGEGEETLASVVMRKLKAKGLTLATAESATGGMLASLIVDQPGASAVLRGAVVAYHADLKHDLLGVPKAVLKREGSVSAEVTLRMARGARKALGADIALATTGVGGPDLDEKGTPVGHGFVALAGPGRGTKAESVLPCHFSGDRNAIRRRLAWAALDLLRRSV
jgi:nicotinamide-nucleotide amidase